MVKRDINRIFLNTRYDNKFFLAQWDMKTKEKMLPAIMLATDMEHDFPEWIGINELTYSIVVGMILLKED